MVLRRSPVCLLVVVAAILLGTSAAQQPPGAAPLSIEEVVKLVQSGFSEDLIITKIKKNGKAFNLSTDELLELKKSGVNDTIVKYLLDPAQPYTPAPPPPPPAPKPEAAAPAPAPKPGAPPKKYPDDPHAGQVPPDPGLYRFPQNVPEKTDIKMLLGEAQGPGLGKVLMKKGKVTAYLAGSSAKSRVAESAPVFYIRLSEGKPIEELLLLTLDRKKDRREIDMGPPGPKPEWKRESLKAFDSLEVGPSLFRLTPPKLSDGEYFFYLIGSAEPPKGNCGKGYDFTIDTRPPAKAHK